MQEILQHRLPSLAAVWRLLRTEQMRLVGVLTVGLVVSVLLAGEAFAQESGSLEGTVTDAANGEPLPGANVVLVGTDQGAATGAEGNYTIRGIEPGTYTVRASFLGFQENVQENVQVRAGEATTVNFVLQQEERALDELVVVGYGEQERQDVTSAISRVTGEELAESPVASASEALQGRTPGVTIAGDAPGEEPQVRIRGLTTPNTNSPLFVVDGVPTGGTLNVPSNDIESVEVLKDASAASIYGSRAAGGVVLVTTKRGTESDGIQADVNSYVGFQEAWKTKDLLSTQEYVNFWSDIPGGDVARFDDIDPGSAANVDWQDVIFRKAPITSQNVAFSGGGETAQYRVSLGYLNQRGIIEASGAERYSLSVNTDFDLGQVEVGESIRVNHMVRDNVAGDAGGRSVLEHTVKMAPYIEPRDPSNPGGFNGPDQVDDNDAENPLRIQNLGTDQRQETSLNGNVYGELQIIEGLSLRSVLGAEAFWGNDYSFTPSFRDGEFHNSNEANLSEVRQVFFSPLSTNTLTYDQSFGAHSVNLVGGVEGQYSLFRSAGVEGQNALTDALRVPGSVEDPVAQGSRTRDVLLSSFARLTYNYDSRYLVEGSIRRDGYSRFGPENKVGYFPSASFGWNVAEEAFLEDGIFDQLKLRASWGVVGNNNAVGAYETQATINTNYNYVDANGNLLTAATIEALSNAALKWETTTMTNVGLDVSVLNNQIDFSAEYYQNESEDLLLVVPLPESFGFTSDPRFNTADAKTDGFEVSLGYQGGSEDFNWDISANIGTQNNEVTSLGQASPLNGARYGAPGIDITRVTEGEPIYHFFGYKMDRLYQEDDFNGNSLNGDLPTPEGDLSGPAPGDIKFTDVNGDGVVNTADRTNIGNPMPDYTYGLNASLNWKDLDFSALFQGAGGHQIYRAWAFWTEGMTRVFNAEASVLDHWTPQNTDTDVPRATIGDRNAIGSSRWVEDGDYLRLKEVTLGYTVPVTFGGTLQNFRVYVQSRNALTFTGYDGYDPEVGVWSDNSDDFTSDYGVDFGQMPQPRTYTFGVQLSF